MIVYHLTFGGSEHHIFERATSAIQRAWIYTHGKPMSNDNLLNQLQLLNKYGVLTFQSPSSSWANVMAREVIEEPERNEIKRWG